MRTKHVLSGLLMAGGVTAIVVGLIQDPGSLKTRTQAASASSLRGDGIARSVGQEMSQTSLNALIVDSISDPRFQTVRATPREQRAKSLGVPRDIYYMGTRVVVGTNGHSYCSGLLLDLYFSACERYASQHYGTSDFALAGVTPSNFKEFRRDFYGVDGNRRTLVNALVSRGLALEIDDPEDAQPGDLVQFWRLNNSGHSVVFLGWERDDSGERIGIVYWSIQEATGPARKSEFFGDGPRGVHRASVFIARALAPSRL